MQKVGAHAVSFRHGQTDTQCINFPFFESVSCRVIPNNLAIPCTSYYLATLYCCIQDIDTIKNAVTCTQTGRRDTVAGV